MSLQSITPCKNLLPISNGFQHENKTPTILRAALRLTPAELGAKSRFRPKENIDQETSYHILPKGKLNQKETPYLVFCKFTAPNQIFMNSINLGLYLIFVLLYFTVIAMMISIDSSTCFYGIKMLLFYNAGDHLGNSGKAIYNHPDKRRSYEVVYGLL